MANEPEKAVNLLWAVDEIIIALFFRKPTLTRPPVFLSCLHEYLPGVLARLHRASFGSAISRPLTQLWCAASAGALSNICRVCWLGFIACRRYPHDLCRTGCLHQVQIH